MTCAALASLAIAFPAAATAAATTVQASAHVASAHATRHASSRHTGKHSRTERHGRTTKGTGGTAAGEEGHRKSHSKSAQHGTRAAKTTDRPTADHGKTSAATRTKGDTEHPKASHVKQSTPAPAPAPAPAPPPTCTETGITPTPENLEEVREVTLCLINRERVANGEQPLKLDRKLARAAQGHSEDMINEDYFSHEAPNGSTPLQRMEEVGYIYSHEIGYEVGENIAWGTLWLATPASIVESWMNSPEHRANILDANYVDTGMGVVAAAPPSRAEGQAGAIYTQDFGVIIAG
ncbi:MAG TPA: CAP domain-containing protein [Solirubrobacteraceae bacterium]|nr:CAP domain-containing protein [Solirubrobacteraceae bacterium]